MCLLNQFDFSLVAWNRAHKGGNIFVLSEHPIKFCVEDVAIKPTVQRHAVCTPSHTPYKRVESGKKVNTAKECCIVVSLSALFEYFSYIWITSFHIRLLMRIIA